MGGILRGFEVPHRVSDFVFLPVPIALTNCSVDQNTSEPGKEIKVSKIPFFRSLQGCSSRIDIA